VLGLAATALVTGLCFVLRLRTAPEPFIPLSMLANPIARCAIAANAFGWGAIIGLNIFLPIYLQNVMGLSATHAGLSLMLLMGTLNLSAGAAGQLYGRVQHYKTVPMIGLLLAIASVATLAWRAADLTPLTFQVLLGLIGLGFGPVAPLSTVALQNAIPVHQLGTAIGTMTFSRNLYGTILVAIFGAIVAAADPLHDVGHLAAAPSPELVAGFSRIFLVAAGSMALALLSLLALEEKPLQTAENDVQ
jgi:sugar phosphate permease